MFYNKYLVIGGNSLVGSELYNKLLNLKKNVKITTRRKNHKNRDLHFDLISPNDLDIHNSIVYFCAAETNISKCEKEPIISNKINYINTVQTIKNLLNKNCKIIYLSTQAVFSGQKNLCKENDNKDPTCNYGIQKNKVEDEIISMKNVSIIRLTKIFSKNQGILSKWIESLENKKKIEVFNDLYTCPISINFVTNFLVNLKDDGIFHLSGDERISYYDLIKKFCIINNLNINLINDIKYKDSDKSIIYKPMYSVLGTCHKNKNNIQTLNSFLNDTKIN